MVESPIHRVLHDFFHITWGFRGSVHLNVPKTMLKPDLLSRRSGCRSPTSRRCSHNSALHYRSAQLGPVAHRALAAAHQGGVTLLLILPE